MKSLIAVVLASLLASVSFAQLREVPDSRQCWPPQASEVQRWVNPPQHHNFATPQRNCRGNNSGNSAAAALLLGIIIAAATSDGYTPYEAYQPIPPPYQFNGYGDYDAAALAGLRQQRQVIAAQENLIRAQQQLRRATLGY